MSLREKRKFRKEVKNYIDEQMVLLDDAYEPSIEKTLKHIKEKFGLKMIDFKYRVQWKAKVIYHE